MRLLLEVTPLSTGKPGLPSIEREDGALKVGHEAEAVTASDPTTASIDLRSPAFGTDRSELVKPDVFRTSGEQQTNSGNDRQSPGEMQETGTTKGHDDASDESQLERKIDSLARSGVLERQAELGIGILLMERQLRQAELAMKLMAVLGPDTPIEIAPGVFKTYENTPAGKRLKREQDEFDLKAAHARAGFEREIERVPRSSLPMTSPFEEMPPQSTNFTKDFELPDIELIETYRSAGENLAIISFDERRMKVLIDDRLPGGGKVVEIGPGRLLVDRHGQRKLYRLIAR